MRLSAQDLGLQTRHRVILSGVSLSIAPGETLGLIGPNGSGKSTLLRLLAGLERQGRGQVALDGQPMRAMPRREIARRLAFVAQHAETSDALTARQVVELGRTPWLSALAPYGAADAAVVEAALAQVGMTALAEQPWPTLSGGERQRIQIARALAQRPRILLLDEPTNHLDIHHQVALLRLVSDLPLTVVMALHDLNQAMGCDRLAVLSNGRLVALGPPAQVLTPDLLRLTFRIHASTLCDPQDGARQFRFHCLEGETDEISDPAAFAAGDPRIPGHA